MLSNKARKLTQKTVTSIALTIAKLGVTPNMFTVMGCLLNIGVMYLLAKGMFRIGALAMIFVNIFDAFDGALARATNKVTKFGAFLDSTLDRFAEAFIFGGLLWYYLASGGHKWEIILIYIVIVGSLTTSYARARAEGAGFECKVGIFTRFERFVVLVLGLLSHQIFYMLLIMAVLSNITSLQRIFYIYNKEQ